MIKMMPDEAAGMVFFISMISLLQMKNQNVRFILINIVVTFCLAIVLEAIFWLGLKFPEAIPSFLLRPYIGLYLSQDRKIIQMTTCAQYDPELFYTLKPGSCVFENREFSVATMVNHKGLRDDEQSLEAPEIIALGDSYTMGWGVNQQETFPQVLEKLTNKKVLNTGISSYGTARELTMLNRLDLSNLRYLVIQYHANDYEENLTYLKNGFNLPIQSEKKYDSLKAAINQRAEYYPFKYLAGLSKNIAKSVIPRQPKDTVNTQYEARAFLDILSHHLSEHKQFQIIVFRTDVPGQLEKDQFIETVDSLSNTNPYQGYNIVTFQTRDFLADEDFFILDDHINEKGHNKIGRALSQYIEDAPAAGTKILVNDYN